MELAIPMQVVTRVSLQYRLAESRLQVPACASLLSGMETSPRQRVEVPVLADQDFEDMFLADDQTRLVRETLREHDPVASLPSTILYQYNSVFSQFYSFLN